MGAVVMAVEVMVAVKEEAGKVEVMDVVGTGEAMGVVVMVVVETEKGDMVEMKGVVDWVEMKAQGERREGSG